jgi:hypothetical protein
VILESYPQMILNVFIMQSLQIDDWLNILMFIIRLRKIIVRQIGKCDFISFFDLIVSSEKLTPQFFKNLINRLGF